jgi:hypothetical protein
MWPAHGRPGLCRTFTVVAGARELRGEDVVSAHGRPPCLRYSCVYLLPYLCGFCCSEKVLVVATTSVRSGLGDDLTIDQSVHKARPAGDHQRTSFLSDPPSHSDIRACR